MQSSGKVSVSSVKVGAANRGACFQNVLQPKSGLGEGELWVLGQ